MNDVMTSNQVAEPVIKMNNAKNDAPKISREEVEELNRQSKRMQDLIEQVNNISDPKSKELMQECISEILTFYGRGLERILDILMNENNQAATKIINELMEDSFISGLLLIHDLHPLDLQTRLHLALEKVSPYIESHGGSVEIVSLEDGIATIKMAGSCKSCKSSSVTLELAIKQSIEEHCPDLLELKVEGIEPAPEKENKPKEKTETFGSKWKTINVPGNISDGGMKFFEINGTPLIICNLAGQLYAYRNKCPACDLPLSSGSIDGTKISCRLGHHYDIKEAGKCTDDPDLQLDPFPLLEENGEVKIAV